MERKNMISIRIMNYTLIILVISLLSTGCLRNENDQVISGQNEYRRTFVTLDYQVSNVSIDDISDLLIRYGFEINNVGDHYYMRFDNLSINMTVEKPEKLGGHYSIDDINGKVIDFHFSISYSSSPGLIETDPSLEEIKKTDLSICDYFADYIADILNQHLGINWYDKSNWIDWEDFGDD